VGREPHNPPEPSSAPIELRVPDASIRWQTDPQVPGSLWAEQPSVAEAIAVPEADAMMEAIVGSD
jgi:hypothetical protein